mgnify:FL=1
MKFLKHQTGFIGAVLILLCVFVYPLTAEAYIDPGTGRVIIQAVIASIAVVGIYFRVIWRRAAGLFMYFSSKKKKAQEAKKEAIETNPIKSDEHTEQL